MILARLVCSVFAVTLVSGWATPSLACDDEKTTAAAAQANACNAKSASAAMAADDCCAAKGATKAKSTTTKKSKNTSIIYVNGSPQAQNTVVLAVSEGGDAATAGKTVEASTAVSNGSCASKSAAAYTAGAEGSCASKHAAASASNGSCAAKGTSATAVAASTGGTKNSSCASKGATASAGHCTSHGMAVMAGMGATENCEACFDMVACGDALTAVGAHRQTVRLKNGVMYVFTADSQRDVNAVQAAVARRVDQMSKVLTAGDNVKLCGDCKSFRGAIASGKLTREVVNIEGGTLALITSSDPMLVSRLHAMTDTKVAARIKS